MIIVDLQQVMVASLMMQPEIHKATKVEESLLRHMVLNSIRSYNVKFKAKFGEMIIACDGQNYWRKEIFPYYKARRAKDREESKLDWGSIFESFNKIRSELKEFFPYRVIHVNEAEADDVIGTLCNRFGNSMEKILVLSGDKDFRQLQSYVNVSQYDPTRKKMITETDPARYLKEHIMRGDKGDGVPNFLSPDNAIVLNIRQKSIFQKSLDVWLEQDPKEFCDNEMLRGYKRNEALVDLSKIPEKVIKSINSQYDDQTTQDRSKLFRYFIDYGLKNLQTDIDQF